MYNKPQPLIDVAARLAELRFTVLDTVNSSPYTTPEERAKTAAAVAKCQNEQTLVKWYCNLLTELSRREMAPPVVWANAQQRDTIFSLLNHPKVSRQQKTSVMLTINRLTEKQASELIGKLYAQTGLTPRTAAAPKKVPAPAPAPAPAKRMVRPTSKADLQAAARFSPANSVDTLMFEAYEAGRVEFLRWPDVAPLPHSCPNRTYWTETVPGCKEVGDMRPARVGEPYFLTTENN